MQTTSFHTGVFNKLTVDQYQAFSLSLQELAEDMEDYYRVQKTGKQLHRSDYDDASVLDSLSASHAYQS